jgi:DNA-binding transcriptional LysR family regulator
VEIKLFKTFLLVAKLLNITKAAQQLSFSQPAITAQICSLEDAFHVKLFKRNGKRLALTDAGILMVDYAERFVSLYEETQNAMRSFGCSEDNIKIGVSTQIVNYFLPNILLELQAQMPHLHVNVEVCMNTQEVLRGVSELRFDLGFIHGQNSMQHIQQHNIWNEKIVWVANAEFINKHPLKEEIIEYPIINFSEGSVLRGNLEECINIADVNSVIEYSDSEAIKRAVIAGLGIAYLPITLVRDEVERGILTILKQGPPMCLCIAMIHRKDKMFTVPMYALLLSMENQPGADGTIKDILQRN